MKLFRSEDHPEVGKDLDGLRKRVEEEWPEVKVGSSGCGEITLRFDLCTFYARKYRRREGWSLTCYWPRSGGMLRPERLLRADLDAVADVIGEILDGKGERTGDQR